MNADDGKQVRKTILHRKTGNIHSSYLIGIVNGEIFLKIRIFANMMLCNSGAFFRKHNLPAHRYHQPTKSFAVDLVTLANQQGHLTFNFVKRRFQILFIKKRIIAKKNALITSTKAFN